MGHMELRVARADKFNLEIYFFWNSKLVIANTEDESEIVEPFVTTSDTCFLAVYVSELSGICYDAIEGHEY